jgi:hypothetical protein
MMEIEGLANIDDAEGATVDIEKLILDNLLKAPFVDANGWRHIMVIGDGVHGTRRIDLVNVGIRVLGEPDMSSSGFASGKGAPVKLA